MTEYLKDLQSLPENSASGRRGEKTSTSFSDSRHPPINLGPYDNPLLWNKLDPFGADRGHQRRPLTVSRDFMELNQVPIVFRDHCVHRWIPFHRCMKNLKPVTWGTTNCHEFEESWMVCRAFETYRMQLLKKKFMDLTKDYTAEDKKFFPSMMYLGFPYYLASFYWSLAASSRLSGWDERDPANPVMWKEPNRSLMRAEFNPTNWEKGSMTSAYGHKIIPDSIVFEEMPGYPLSEEKRPREE